MTLSNKYVLLPRRGFLHKALRELEPAMDARRGYTPVVMQSRFAPGIDIRIIDSISEDGPKLVELDHIAARAVNRHPDIRALKIATYHTPRIVASAYPGAPRPKNKDGNTNVTVRVTQRKKGKRVPARGFLVTAFSDYKAQIGDEKVTDHFGEVTLRLPKKSIERLYCEQLWGWGAYHRNVPVRSRIDLELEPISSKFTDCVRRYYRDPNFDSETPVTVGVIDSGVGPHEDLNIVGGLSTVTGEHDKDRNDYSDVFGHGTFIAGLIGSRGRLFPKLRGLAPGVQIRSYRIFGKGVSSQTDSHALARAIDRARIDRCDIVNLSVEDGGNDGYLKEAVSHARDHGMIVVVAAGNDSRKAVSHDLRQSRRLAVCWPLKGA